jgi:hypothetical protein
MKRLLPRKHDRLARPREVRVRTLPDGPETPGYAIDLSRGGVQLFSERSLSVGETVALTWADRFPPATLHGQVVYARVQLDGTFAGVRFHLAIAPEVYRALCGTRETSA